MRPPHWLGRVIGKRRELNNIALAIAKSPRFRQAIQKGIDAGSQLETVLITGASSGIGLELAKLFATDNSNLVLVARSRKKLDQLATELHGEHGVEVRVVAKDLADPQSPKAIFDALTAESVTVDVLVNNAGFGAAGAVADLPLEKQLDMIQVNVAALTHLTTLFLPDMIRRRSGSILNVASAAAFQPGPYMAVYYATKAFVLSFTGNRSQAESVFLTKVIWT